jgi:hypothetical protein
VSDPTLPASLSSSEQFPPAVCVATLVVPLFALFCMYSGTLCAVATALRVVLCVRADGDVCSVFVVLVVVCVFELSVEVVLAVCLSAFVLLIVLSRF